MTHFCTTLKKWKSEIVELWVCISKERPSASRKTLPFDRLIHVQLIKYLCLSCLWLPTCSVTWHWESRVTGLVLSRADPLPEIARLAQTAGFSRCRRCCGWAAWITCPSSYVPGTDPVSDTPGVTQGAASKVDTSPCPHGTSRWAGEGGTVDGTEG